jgi:hypothetical protein
VRLACWRARPRDRELGVLKGDLCQWTDQSIKSASARSSRATEWRLLITNLIIVFIFCSSLPGDREMPFAFGYPRQAQRFGFVLIDVLGRRGFALSSLSFPIYALRIRAAAILLRGLRRERFVLEFAIGAGSSSNKSSRIRDGFASTRDACAHRTDRAARSFNRRRT